MKITGDPRLLIFVLALAISSTFLTVAILTWIDWRNELVLCFQMDTLVEGKTIVLGPGVYTSDGVGLWCPRKYQKWMKPVLVDTPGRKGIQGTSQLETVITRKLLTEM